MAAQALATRTPERPAIKLRLVHKGAPYPVSESSEARPFHLWDAKARKSLRWRYYTHLRHAHVAALIECRFAAIGYVIEVFDVRNGKLSGQYIRRVHSVEFIGEPKA